MTFHPSASVRLAFFSSLLVHAPSGGGQGVTSTILTNGRTFIPVPNEIIEDFLPKEGERKRLAVRGDILYIGNSEGVAANGSAELLHV